MRKLVESTFVSLDGSIENPQNWSPPYWDDEHSGYAGSCSGTPMRSCSGARPTRASRRPGRRGPAPTTSPTG
jgi:hypothetical protein